MATKGTRPTIHDIARVAGVSANTVSKVLNDKPGVADETRARINDLIKEMGYHPHIGARSLRGAHQGCIGVTLPAPAQDVPVSQSFFIWLFRQLYRVFGAQGQRVCFDMNPYQTDGSGDYARSVWDHLFSVCIVAGPLANDDTVIHRIHGSGVPYLALGRLDSLPECSSATVDYEEGAYLSTKYLLDKGHKKIAMLRAFSGYQPGRERTRGYRRALEEAGVPFDENLLRSVSIAPESVANMVHRLLVDREVTALIDCSATEDGSSINQGAQRAGRTIGQDLDVVCWTYERNRAVLSTASAHVWLPVREAATEGLEQLARWYRGDIEGPIRILYPPVLTQEVAGDTVPRPERLFDPFE